MYWKGLYVVIDEHMNCELRAMEPDEAEKYKPNIYFLAPYHGQSALIGELRIDAGFLQTLQGLKVK